MQRHRGRIVLALWLALLALSAGTPVACNLDVTVPPSVYGSDGGNDGSLVDVAADVPPDLSGQGVGGACTTDGECRAGLRCSEGACEPGGAAPEGTPCVLSAECGEGLYCSVAGACAPAGTGLAGSACASGAECEAATVCVPVGFQGTCQAAGTHDVGQACLTVTDCLAGLRCADDGTCQPGSLLFGAPLFTGTECAPDDAETGPPRPYFELPRGGVPPHDFYRLPFPNDARLRDGRVDLSGHPVPGPGLVGFDLVQRLVEAIQADQAGWGTNPTIYFRYSSWIDSSTVVATGEGKTVRMVDLTPGSADYGRELDLGWFATTERDRYLCRNSLRLHRPWSRPLRPGSTYAVVVTSGVHSAAKKADDGTETPGVPLQRDADFDAVLGASRPSDADLGPAWDAYAPLREWLSTGALPAADVVGATVFTTDRVRDVLPALRKAVDADAVPAFHDWTPCGAGVVSPCDDGLTGDAHVRGCFADDPDFYEVHARVDLPVFQQGTRPYLQPADGGDVRLDGDAAEVVGHEAVCVALTVPKGLEMPPGGWPVVLYAHGTGGSFRSHVSEGLAGMLTRVDDAGDPQGVALLGFDQVMHGSRRGSDLSPDALVYNFLNPRAARGNLYQAAADTLALVRALKAVVVPAEGSPTGAEIRFDPAQVFFVGHSQGGTSGPLALPYEPGVPLAVYSGAGGGLALSLLKKTEPVPIVEGVKLATQDPDVGATHPVLGLMQMYFDAVDPLNYAALQFAYPDEGQARHHVLHLYGQGDGYTPPDCLGALAGAMYVTLAEPVLDDLGGVAKAAPPISGNWAGTTAVTAQYAPQGYDGHFVLFRNPAARRQVRGFLSSALRDGTPTLVP